MQNKPRRQCFMVGQCILFNIFQITNLHITQKHIEASQFIRSEGIKVLENITSDFLKKKNQQSSQGSISQVAQNSKCDKKNTIITKKQLVTQISQLSDTQKKKKFSLQMKSEVKQRESSSKSQKSKKKRLVQAQQLAQIFKKLEIQYKGQQKCQNDDLNNIQFENKSLTELIQLSNKKIEERMAINQARKEERDDQSDSSYPITDYSSNQSSNQNVYDQQLREEGFFGNNQSILRSFPVVSQPASYQAMKLSFTPKKSKSNAKRIFIRNKKIPKWAENIQKVQEEVLKQKEKPQTFDPSNIYGVCYVQKLDTNVIFNSESIYLRGSSAKWNRYPYNQFIE